ncbi:MAG: O-antigen ligase family protein [Candidatus Cloacimonetes bacterium]|nr:O-antigen ligase family protein [Candidatus Cloacimonadota bacterium]
MSRSFTNFILFFDLALILNLNYKKNINSIFKIVTVGSLLVATIGILQHFLNLFNLIPRIHIVSSTFVNTNFFSSALFLLLPFCLYTFFSFSRKWQIISFISVNFTFYLITIIKARSVWLAFFVAIVFLIMLTKLIFKKQIKLSRFFKSNKVSLLLSTIVIIILLALMFPNFHEDQLRKNKDVTSTATLKIRVHAWQKSIPMILEHPLLGVGIGNWKTVLPKYGVEGLKTEMGAYQYLRPHNDFIWVLAESGIFAFLFYLSLFGLTIYYLLKVITKSTDTEDRFKSLFILFGIVGYMVVAFFSFPRERIYHALILILYFAISTIIYHKNFPIKKSVKKSHLAFFIIINILLLSIMICFNYHRLKSEVYTFLALKAHQRGMYEKEIAAFSKINRQIYNMTPSKTPILFYRGLAYYNINKTGKALKDFRDAYNKNPYYIYILNNIASCFEEMGQHENAIKFYKKVLDISPGFEDALINFAAVYYNLGRFDQAKEIIERCDSIKNYPRYNQYREKIESKLQELKSKKLDK